MAVGRKQTEVPAVTARVGRISPPPEGGIYVRDQEVAEAIAIRQRIAAFEEAGVKVPEHLQTMLSNLNVSKNASDIKLVDALTGKEMAKVKHIDKSGFDETGQPSPPGGYAEDQLPAKGEEPAPEDALPDAEVGPIEADLSPEVVRPMPDSGEVPAGYPALPDQTLESQEDAEARVAEEAGERDKGVEKAARKAAKEEGEAQAAAPPRVREQKKAEAAADVVDEAKGGPHGARRGPRTAK